MSGRKILKPHLSGYVCPKCLTLSEKRVVCCRKLMIPRRRLAEHSFRQGFGR